MKNIRKFALCALSLCLIFLLIFPCGAVQNVYKKNPQAEKKIALTFDDGPHPIYTGKVLGILKKYGITATFFVIGKNVENYPDAFRELLASGCEIGNHTYSHKNLNEMSREEIIEELEKNERLIWRDGEIKTKLVRPPRGIYNSNLLDVCMERELKIVLWSIDTLDWAHNPSSHIVKQVLGTVSDGDIILMHDYTSGKNTTLAALDTIIRELLARGYKFVGVSELLSE